jgi:RNA polymerase sigma-70 factor, ECF subfamily
MPGPSPTLRLVSTDCPARLGSAEFHAEPPSPRRREPPDHDDDELMLLARGGYREAFDTLVSRHQARALGIALRYLGRSHMLLAQDVTQNAFLSVYRALPRYQPRGQFAAYLHRTLLNHCRMAHRRARLETQAFTQELGMVEQEHTTEAEIIARERYRHLEVATQALGHKLREVVVLRFGAGLRYDEIAETLDVPLGTVKRRLFDALAILHTRMEKLR